MFKADGTPIKNPEKYVASIKKNGYTDPLFTEAGKEIKDPSGFLDAMKRRASTNKQSSAKPSKAPKTQAIGDSIMYKEDGTPIKNPERYVASLEKNGYSEPLFTPAGTEIRNPSAYLASQTGVAVAKEPPERRKGGAKGGGKKSQTAALALPAPVVGSGRKRDQSRMDSGQSAIMFKADGTPIKNPERYVASLERNGYTDPLFTPKGTEIRDPVAYLASKSGASEEPETKRLRGNTGKGGSAAPLALPASEGLYKADGSKIKNPVGYVAAIERNGYTNPVFTAEGEEIRNPTAFLAAAEKRVGSGTVQNSTAKIAKAAKVELFKANGTAIKNPEKYVASIEKNGYTDPLFTAEGEEIRNPKAYIEAQRGNTKVTNKKTQVLGRTRTPGIGAIVKKRAPEASSKRMTAKSAIEKPEGLYKANGIRIKNPSAYVAKFEVNGQEAPLFNARGQEIKNPAAYVAKMMENEQKNGAQRRMVPTNRGGKLSYYGTPIGAASLGQRLKSTLASSIRGARKPQRRKIGEAK